LILGKISKFDASRCHILRLKCTKFDFAGAPPQNTLGELTALPQTPQLYLRGLLLRAGRGKREVRGRGGKRRGNGRGQPPPDILA